MPPTACLICEIEVATAAEDDWIRSESTLYSYFVQIRDSDDTILRNAIVPLSRTASVRCRCCL